ncbi:YjiH family protein [Endozoicomonas atrinae]|uniref:YjiH family protein n=1 Tax=Endozoicomonas atrinae TaxID=1333660 RepID=UPI003B0078BF
MNQQKLSKHSFIHWCKFIGLSSIGFLMFFIPINLHGVKSIPIDHIVLWIKHGMGEYAGFYALVMVIAGTLLPICNRSLLQKPGEKYFLGLKCLGLLLTVFALFETGPALLHEPDVLPFLLNKLVIPVSLIVPVGSVFLMLLVSYGLLESTGVILHRIMMPIWRTPGRSAIDAVASFVGSYSTALLITNRLYINGLYSARQAAIIATGFSTVSATTMIAIAKTLNLMEIWNLYFWTTLAVTFMVTAITARIPPLSSLNDLQRCNAQEKNKPFNKQLLKTALEQGLQAAANAPRLTKNLLQNLKDGIIMTITIIPTIMSIGTIGLLTAKYTPVFDWIGYLFYPVIWIWGIDSGTALAKASATGLTEIFLPAMLMQDANLSARFAAGIVCVSPILFFSASIPCILATSIPLTVRQLILVWFVRTLLTLALAIPISLFLVN